jgi:hypothetical protein
MHGALALPLCTAERQTLPLRPTEDVFGLMIRIADDALDIESVNSSCAVSITVRLALRIAQTTPVLPADNLRLDRQGSLGPWQSTRKKAGPRRAQPSRSRSGQVSGIKDRQ